MTKKSTSKKVTTSRGPAPKAVIGQKVLASGKLGKEMKFASARAAALKVAPTVSVKTATSSIYHALAGDQPTAYGYKWSR